MFEGGIEEVIHIEGVSNKCNRNRYCKWIFPKLNIWSNRKESKLVRGRQKKRTGTTWGEKENSFRKNETRVDTKKSQSFKITLIVTCWSNWNDMNNKSNTIIQCNLNKHMVFVVAFVCYFVHHKRVHNLLRSRMPIQNR